MMVVVMMVMVQTGQAGRPGVLRVMVQAEHQAGRSGVPVMVIGRRRVQLAAPRGHRVQIATASAAAAASATGAAVTAAQRAQRGLPRCRDHGVRIAAGRAARPVANAGHRPSVFFRGHHRDAFRAHRPIHSVRQLGSTARQFREPLNRIQLVGRSRVNLLLVVDEKKIN